jgi:DNA (cytosine-5)-methyltransferase 1
VTLTIYDAFHGVGGFRYGLEQAGMKCVGGCEIDKYACQAYGVINDEDCRPTDIRTVDPFRLPDFDIFVGGFPCQDLSVAGKRKGFDGERSVLFFEILRICEVKRPTYILLENVTGLFSHNGGETFRIVLQSLDELGYDAEWQMHNSAAYVPQNRERVFIIGHLRGRGTRPVFPFGSENENAIEVIGKLDGNHEQNSRVYGIAGIAPTLSTMQGGGQEPKVAIPVLTPDREEKRQNGRRFKEPGEPSFTLTAQDKHGIYDGYRIRKLTPLECFRLQSFPDEWYYKLKEHGISDSQLYKMAGNAVTSVVAYEIGRRLILPQATDATEPTQAV